MTRFAAKTDVSVEKSRAEIETIVRRYGADGYVSGWEGSKAMVQFRCAGRYVRFDMVLPDPSEDRFTTYTRGGTSFKHRRTDAAAAEFWGQACRQKWRALALMIKAKLEGIDSGIVTFEQEFMGHVVMPDGGTVYDHVKAKVAIAYETGAMQPLLPGHERDRGRRG